MDKQELTPDVAGITARAKAILMNPAGEWPVIAAEQATPKEVFIKYAVPLAAIGPVATLIGSLVFGYSAFGVTYRPGIMTALGTAIASYVMALIGLWVVSWVANFLAPKFGGKDDFASAFKLVAYSMTASWLAGVFGLLPALSFLSILGLYGLYLLYKGATPVMNVPEDKSVVYTIVTVVVAAVVSVVFGMVAAAVAGAGAIASGGLSAADSVSGGDEITIDFGEYGRIEGGADGAVATFRDENGEEVTITVDKPSE